MSDTTNTPNVASVTPTDDFDALLASAGMSVSVRKRLTVAPSVIKAFTDSNIKRVVVFGSESIDSEAFTASVSKAPNTLVIRDLDTGTQAMSTHIGNALKSRKIAYVNNALKNADGTIVARVFQRPTVSK